MATTAYDYNKNNTGNQSGQIAFGVNMGDDTKTNYEETSTGESVVSSILPGGDANASIERMSNVFAQSTMPLWGNLMDQSIGRLIGEMPTDSDKAIMHRLLDYVPEKSKGISHAIMANAARSLRGDPQASSIAAKLLDDKQKWDTKENALQFGILKLADPNVSTSTKRSVMAAIRNNWDDIYGPDKSVKMLQGVGFLAQIGSIFEALSAKAAASGGASRLTSYSSGYNKPEDTIEELSKRANDMISRIDKRAYFLKNTYGKSDEEIQKDEGIKTDTALYNSYINKIKELSPGKYGIDKQTLVSSDMSSIGL